MTNFILLATVVSVLVVALLVWSSLKQQGANRNRDARELCFRAHEQMLAELKADHEAGRLGDEAYNTARFDAERRLVDDIRAIDDRPLVSRTYRWVVPMVFSLPLLATGLYLLVGNLAATDPEATFIRTGNVGQFVNAVTQLEEKVAANPDDLQSQLMLARSYRAMGRYADAVQAFGKAWSLIHDSPTELAIFAGVLAIYRGEFAGKPDELLDQALALDANNHDALTLAGGSAFQKGNYSDALRHWQKLHALLSDGTEEKQWLTEQIEEARRKRDNPGIETPAGTGRSLGEIHALPHGSNPVQGARQ